MKNINIIIVIILTLVTTLLIGTPINEGNVYIVYIALGIFSLIYYIKKIVEKERINLNKIDLCVIILAISTTIPLIFGTYVSIDGTTKTCIKYFSIINIYLIAKNECQKDSRNINIIINTIITSILILCLIGIDEMHGNYLSQFKQLIKYKYIEYDEMRMSSLFSYPNTMGAVAGIGIFLCMGCILQNKNIKIKIIYIIASAIMFLSLILAYSRLVYILFAITGIIYLFILMKKYKIKVNRKIIIIVSILLISYVAIGLKIPEKVKINNQYQKILYSVKQNTDYNFIFDFETNHEFTIKLTEKNEYFDTIKENEIKISELTGSKGIKIKTHQNTKVIYLNINATDLIINNVTLNNKRIILKYKLLPTTVIEKIQSFSLKNKSVWERATFIKDALKSIKENWLLGLGGNAWRTIQYNVQSYNYYANEVHSYPIQIFLENGIIGFLACIVTGICIITYVKNKKYETSIIISIIFIAFHSFVDFDMSFFYVLFIVTLMLATISSKDENYILSCNQIIYSILIILSITIIYISSVEKYFNSHKNLIKINSEWTEEKIYSIYTKLLPFDKEIKMKKYNKLTNEQEIKEVLKNIIITEKYDYTNVVLDSVVEYIKLLSEEELSKEFQFVFEYICETEQFYKYQPNNQIERLKNLKNILYYFNNEEYKQKIQIQFEKEIQEKEKYILDYKKSRYEESERNKYQQQLEEIKKEEYIKWEYQY